MEQSTAIVHTQTTGLHSISSLSFKSRIVLFVVFLCEFYEGGRERELFLPERIVVYNSIISEVEFVVEKDDHKS